MTHESSTVFVKVNRQVVKATFVEWSAEYPGYATVMHNGRRLTRRIVESEPVDQVVVSDDSCVENAGVNETEFDINERFNFMTQMVELVISGNANGMIVTGSGGLGKTHTVMATLADNDLGEADYVVVKGYSTPRALYNTMYDNNGKIIVFDDCDSILEDKSATNLLKAALDSREERTVSWMSSREGDVPNQFEFKGRIIFISNKSLSQIPQPLLSRSLFVDVTMTTEEKIKRIATIMPGIKTSMSNEQREQVMNLLKRYADSIDDLNIRTFIKVADICESGMVGWERLATYLVTRKVCAR